MWAGAQHMSLYESRTQFTAVEASVLINNPIKSSTDTYIVVIFCHGAVKTLLIVIAPLKDCTYSMVWCPNLHSYGTQQPCNFFQRAHWWEPVHHSSLMCSGGSFPQGLPELSEAADDRVLHLTASRSNNCKSHLSESPPCDWSVSTGSFKAAGHIALNREQHIFLRDQLYMPVTLYNKLLFV